MQLLKFFRVDLAITFACLVVAYFYGSWEVVIITLMLILLEIVFSFDNAAVNAKYLMKMSPFWRKMFLTVGILIAVFGMRLVFPFVIVSVAGSINPVEAWNLAMARGDVNTPGTYGYILNSAHSTIAAFGGMFLLMLFLDFVFDTKREVAWLTWIERPLQKIGRISAIAVAFALLALIAVGELFADDAHRHDVYLAGIFGIVVFLAVNGLATFMEEAQERREEEMEAKSAEALATGRTMLLTGQAAFSMFMFLEVLDASFSFDGVLGAFAVTTDPIIIAMGLGVGALFVRSMTVYLVDHNALSNFRYMEHGAHWAIGVLAVMLLVTVKFEIPEIVIGMAGIVLITASIMWSIRANKREAAHAAIA
ncbi:DUF475 domain-containing protein [Galactobacter caseinivorans]|uniref:DUF475 domain-containing protein n=1 Tax=Galactobacter caseinivorans TaxID=2676123 RepID=A0A496PGM7_9MICC|nr:DUF475 domain-containing protein [Galactobacter caseinivorans]RKW69627.1 DUF475 domain-containing protein [Galactobacter caseinivorans]